MNKIKLGVSNEGVVCGITPSMACRHGLIAGATGTGKTITLRAMAEGFSGIGVPVLLADMKGDLSGMCRMGSRQDFVRKAEQLGLKDYAFNCYPCCYWDVYREAGIPIKVPVSEVGSFLLARVLGLTRVQCGVLDLIFKISEDRRYKLHTLEDLKKVIHYVEAHTEDLFSEYGTIFPSSVGAILRAVIGLERQGGCSFFDYPSLDLNDLMTVCGKYGTVNIMECTKLIQQPLMYSTSILWLLNKLYNELPEVGDCAKPRFVVFFDEAHLLFEDANKAVVAKVAQTVRLIRSKGVGVYFVSQSPSDIPDKVLSQLSNRVQHSLRAFTPDEMRAVKVAARSFRPNPNFVTEDCIMNLGVGEALISMLDDKGIPEIVQQVKMFPPRSSLEVLSVQDRQDFVKAYYGGILGRYSNSSYYGGDFEDVPEDEPNNQEDHQEYRRYNPQELNFMWVIEMLKWFGRKY